MHRARAERVQWLSPELAGVTTRLRARTAAVATSPGPLGDGFDRVPAGRARDRRGEADAVVVESPGTPAGGGVPELALGVEDPGGGAVAQKGRDHQGRGLADAGRGEGQHVVVGGVGERDLTGGVEVTQVDTPLRAAEKAGGSDVGFGRPAGGAVGDRGDRLAAAGGGPGRPGGRRPPQSRGLPERGAGEGPQADLLGRRAGGCAGLPRGRRGGVRRGTPGRWGRARARAACSGQREEAEAQAGAAEAGEEGHGDAGEERQEPEVGTARARGEDRRRQEARRARR